jgi:hypothetical protein
VKKVARDSTALFHSLALLQATVNVSMLNGGKAVSYLYNNWNNFPAYVSKK